MYNLGTQFVDVLLQCTDVCLQRLSGKAVEENAELITHNSGHLSSPSPIGGHCSEENGGYWTVENIMINDIVTFES